MLWFYYYFVITIVELLCLIVFRLVGVCLYHYMAERNTRPRERIGLPYAEVFLKESQSMFIQLPKKFTQNSDKLGWRDWHGTVGQKTYFRGREFRAFKRRYLKPELGNFCNKTEKIMYAMLKPVILKFNYKMNFERIKVL